MCLLYGYVLKSCSVCSPEKESKLDNGELQLLEERYVANISELNLEVGLPELEWNNLFF